jgi:hypothetical protein
MKTDALAMMVGKILFLGYFFSLKKDCNPDSYRAMSLRVSHYSFSKYNSRKDVKTPRNRLLTFAPLRLGEKKQSLT